MSPWQRWPRLTRQASPPDGCERSHSDFPPVAPAGCSRDPVKPLGQIHRQPRLAQVHQIGRVLQHQRKRLLHIAGFVFGHKAVHRQLRLEHRCLDRLPELTAPLGEMAAQERHRVAQV